MNNINLIKNTLLVGIFCLPFGLLQGQQVLITETPGAAYTLNSDQAKVVSFFSSPIFNSSGKFVQMEDLFAIQSNGTLAFVLPGYEPTPLVFVADKVDYQSSSEYVWMGKNISGGYAIFYSRPEGRGAFIDLRGSCIYYKPVGREIRLSGKTEPKLSP